MKSRRWMRIFQSDGRTLIVAMDHGSFLDRPADGLRDAPRTVREVVSGGADAVMAPLGTARACLEGLRQAGLILSVQAQNPEAVDSALRLGADAVKTMCYPFLEDEEQTPIAALGAECHAWGLPFLVETVPGGFFAGREMRTAEKVAAGARIGAELGADFVKTFYTGDPESFRSVVENCPVPVVILGGERASSEREVLQAVMGAVESGAAGVAMGRNIWGHESPGRMAAAVAAILHGGASLETALRELDPRVALGTGS